MIANITKGATLLPIFNYNENKVKVGDAVLLEAVNVMGDNIKLAQSLMLSYANQSKRKDKFFHVSLNFPAEDISKLDEETFKNIAKDYMKEMGFPEEHPFVIYQHKDTLHPHIHIVTTKINKEGKFIDDSKEYRKSQSITRNLEKKYALTQVNSKKNYTQNLEVKTKITSSSPLREQLNYYLKKALREYRVTSTQELKEYLNKHNLDLDIISGIYADKAQNPKAYEGVIFHTFSNDFKQNQKGIKGSALYMRPTLKNLEKEYSRNKKIVKENRDYIKSSIDNIFKNYEKININEYTQLLRNKGISLYAKYDNAHNLVGLSYTHLKSERSFTGEQIGKTYTAKNMQNKLGYFATQRQPHVITQDELKRFEHRLQFYPIEKQLKLLASIGFKMMVKNDELYINHYKNSNGGYIPYCNVKGQNLTELAHFIKLKGITFSEKDKPIFDYNSARLLGEKELLNLYNMKLNDMGSAYKSMQKFQDELNEFFKETHQKYEEAFFSEDDTIPNDDIADIDRKKGKKKKPVQKK